ALQPNPRANQPHEVGKYPPLAAPHAMSATASRACAPIPRETASARGRAIDASAGVSPIHTVGSAPRGQPLALEARLEAAHEVAELRLHLGKELGAIGELLLELPHLLLIFLSSGALGVELLVAGVELPEASDRGLDDVRKANAEALEGLHAVLQ